MADNVSSGLTVCGRPERDNLNMFAVQGSNAPGDPNYGYITNRCYDQSYTCGRVPNGSSTTMATVPPAFGTGSKCSSLPMTCQNQVGCNLTQLPSACASRLSDCVTQTANSGGHGSLPTSQYYNYFCKSNWDAVDGVDDRMSCCSNLSSTSTRCLPELCAANLKECQPTLAKECTPTNWTGRYEKECDAYTTLQSEIGTSLGPCPGNPTTGPGKNWNCAQQMIRTAVNDFYTHNDPTDDDPFVDKAVGLCRLYPGLCDDILEAKCSHYSSADLDPTKHQGKQYDPDGTNLLRTCGCFLPDNAAAGNYVLDPSIGMTVSCNAICAFPGTIPLYDGHTGKAEQCTGNACVFDNITVNAMNSSAGAVNMNTYCGQCAVPHTPPGTAPKKPLCRCYFNNIHVNSVNSNRIKLQITDNCSECFEYDPKHPTSAKKVPCGQVPTPPSPTPPTPPGPSPGPAPSPAHHNLLLIVGVVILVLFLAVGAWLMFRGKKAGEQSLLPGRLSSEEIWRRAGVN